MQLAAHQLHQLLADRQAQPGALAPPFDSLDLLEGLEDTLQLVGRDPAAGIFDLETMIRY